ALSGHQARTRKILEADGIGEQEVDRRAFVRLQLEAREVDIGCDPQPCAADAIYDRVHHFLTYTVAQGFRDQRPRIDPAIQAIFRAAEQVRFVKGVRSFLAIEQAQKRIAQCRSLVHHAARDWATLQEQDTILASVALFCDV